MVTLCLMLLLTRAETSSAHQQTYVCYSLKAAESILKQTPAVDPLVSQLGYITEPIAIVIDRQRDELILVGKRNPDNPEMYLDDWVVALRSFMLKGGMEDPGVSIDPTSSIQEEDQQYVVRFFGGVRNTRFGKVCFDADYLLKKMSLGLVSTGSRSVISSWHLMQTKSPNLDRQRSEPASWFRTFFWPRLVRVLDGKNAAVIEVCQAGVRATAATRSAAADDAANYEKQFADSLTKYYDQVGATYPVLKDLRDLYGLYGLAKWVWSLEDKPDLSYWLSEYQVAKVDMPRFVQPLRQGFGGIGFGLQVSGEARFSALAILMRDGDPSAFARMVPASRPDGFPLVWSFQFDDEELTTDTTSVSAEYNDLLSRGDYLTRKGELRGATECFNNAIERGWRTNEILWRRALVESKLGNFQAALDNCDEAIKLDSTEARVWYVRGLVLDTSGNRDSALASQERAMAFSRTFEPARLAHAGLLEKKGRFAGALADYDSVLKNNPRSSEALNGQARVHARMGDTEKAWEELNMVIAIDPDFESQEKAVETLTQMREKGEIRRSSLSIKQYPYSSFKWTRTMWEFSLGLRTSYDQGMMFSPPTAILVGQSNYRFSMPVSFGLVLRNRVRLSAEIPLEVVITPVEVGGYYYTTQIVMFTGGIQSATLGASFQLLDGLWKKPYVVSRLSVITPSIKEAFSGYLSGSQGLVNAKIPLGPRIWHGLAGIEWDVPTLTAARIIGWGSFLLPFESSSNPTIGIASGVKFQLFSGETSASIGLVAQRSWRRYSNTSNEFMTFTRYQFFVEKTSLNSVWTTNIGLGQESWPGEKENPQYIFASVNIGKYIWLKRGWF